MKLTHTEVIDQLRNSHGDHIELFYIGNNPSHGYHIVEIDGTEVFFTENEYGELEEMED